jgi:hypothetical protein
LEARILQGEQPVGLTIQEVGRRGGLARAKKLSAKRRSAIAKKASRYATRARKAKARARKAAKKTP